MNVMIEIGDGKEVSRVILSEAKNPPKSELLPDLPGITAV
jgi:hypothetical protein